MIINYPQSLSTYEMELLLQKLSAHFKDPFSASAVVYARMPMHFTRSDVFRLSDELGVKRVTAAGWLTQWMDKVITVQDGQRGLYYKLIRIVI